MSRRFSSLFFSATITIASFVACGEQKDDPPTRDGEAPSGSASPSDDGAATAAPSASAPPSNGGGDGLPEVCRTYRARYTACAPKLPEASRAVMESAYAAFEKERAAAAGDAEQLADMAVTCKASLMGLESICPEG
ncbi:MAG: hypothetical protein AAF928_02590 [Myxococcota bacterium]